MVKLNWFKGKLSAELAISHKPGRIKLMEIDSKK